MMAIFAPVIANITTHQPNEVNLDSLDSYGLPSAPRWWPDSYDPTTGEKIEEAPPGYLLGVDDTGRDQFVRIAYGARTSLIVAFLATGIALVIGVLLGLSAGFFRGKTDTVISRATDVVLALPILLLALGIASACGASAEGCFWGFIQPGLRPVDPHHRSVQLAVHRPHRSRSGPVHPREGVHRGVAVPRGIESADHPPRDPPQCRRTDHRLHDADHPEQHPVRGRSVVPRSRRAGYHPVVGGHAGRCRHGLHVRTVVDDLPGTRSVPHDAGVQPRGGRPSRRPRSSEGNLSVSTGGNPVRKEDDLEGT